MYTDRPVSCVGTCVYRRSRSLRSPFTPVRCASPPLLFAALTGRSCSLHSRAAQTTGPPQGHEQAAQATGPLGTTRRPLRPLRPRVRSGPGAGRSGHGSARDQAQAAQATGRPPQGHEQAAQATGPLGTTRRPLRPRAGHLRPRVRSDAVVGGSIRSVSDRGLYAGGRRVRGR